MNQSARGPGSRASVTASAGGGNAASTSDQGHGCRGLRPDREHAPGRERVPDRVRASVSCERDPSTARLVDAAAHGERRTAGRARRSAELEHGAVMGASRGVRRHAPAVERDAAPRAGHGEPRLAPVEARPEPADEHLEHGVAVVVADEPVRQARSAAVERARRRDAEVGEARPAEVLDERRAAPTTRRRGDVMGSPPRIARVPPGRSRAGGSASTSHSTASVRPMSCQPPGLCARVHARERPGEPDRPGGHARARRVEPRHVERPVRRRRGSRIPARIRRRRPATRTAGGARRAASGDMPSSCRRRRRGRRRRRRRGCTTSSAARRHPDVAEPAATSPGSTSPPTRAAAPRGRRPRASCAPPGRVSTTPVGPRQRGAPSCSASTSSRPSHSTSTAAIALGSSRRLTRTPRSDARRPRAPPAPRGRSRRHRGCRRAGTANRVRRLDRGCRRRP